MTDAGVVGLTNRNGDKVDQDEEAFVARQWLKEL